MYPSISISVSQSVDQSVRQTVNRSVSESVSQTIVSPCIHLSPSQPVSQLVSQSVKPPCLSLFALSVHIKRKNGQATPRKMSISTESCAYVPALQDIHFFWSRLHVWAKLGNQRRTWLNIRLVSLNINKLHLTQDWNLTLTIHKFSWVMKAICLQF